MFSRDNYRKLHLLGTERDLSKCSEMQSIFLSGALRYYRTAKKLEEEHDLPAYMLGLHSIELGLKAFLLGRDKDINYIKNQYGHKLKELYMACASEGLVINIEFLPDLMKWFDEFHYQNASSRSPAPVRYEFYNVPPVPHISYVLEVAQKIIEAQQNWS